MSLVGSGSTKTRRFSLDADRGGVPVLTLDFIKLEVTVTEKGHQPRLHSCEGPLHSAQMTSDHFVS